MNTTGHDTKKTTSDNTRKPRVLVTCDNRMMGGYPTQILGQKYSDVIRDQAGCLPIPLLCTGKEDVEAYLALADGLMLTGSPANVDPVYYGQNVHNAELPLDPARDTVTLPLIRRAVEMGMPIIAICRGLQEINVALGGSLYQAVQEVVGRNDHRGAQGRADASPDETYAAAHPIFIPPGGCLSTILGANELIVNSVHGQGIDRIAPDLVVEATAPDGQIEAVSIKSHPGFSLALQWHPEWKAWENDASQKIFAAFGNACRTWQKTRGPY